MRQRNLSCRDSNVLIALKFWPTGSSSASIIFEIGFPLSTCVPCLVVLRCSLFSERKPTLTLLILKRWGKRLARKKEEIFRPQLTNLDKAVASATDVFK